MIFLRPKGREHKKAEIECGRCQTPAMFLHDDWIIAQQEIHEAGWNVAPELGWVCPNCSKHVMIYT